MQFIQSKTLPKTCIALALAVSGVIGCDDTDSGSRGVVKTTRTAIAQVGGLKTLEPGPDLKAVTDPLLKAADSEAGPAARAVAASTAAQIGLQSATAAANKLNAQSNDVRRTLGELYRLSGLIAGNGITAKGYTAGDHKAVITNLSEQITRMQGNASAATWGEPPTLPTLAAAKQDAAKLQADIDAKQQQLDGLTKKRTEALSRAEVQTKQADGLKGGEAVRAYADASASKKEGDDSAIDIDLVTVQLDRLKADLASVQSQEKIVDTGIATLNSEGKLLESNWGGRRQFASKQTDLAKLLIDGDAKKASIPSIKSLTATLAEQLKAVAETRQAAFDQLSEAAKYAGIAKSQGDAVKSAVQPKLAVGGKEAGTYKSLIEAVHPQKFQYEVGLAQRDTGILSVSSGALLNDVKAAVENVKAAITAAGPGLTVPEELEKLDLAAAATLTAEATERLKESGETLVNVESGDSPEGVKTAAKAARLIGLFANLQLLDIRKAAGDTSAESTRAELHSTAISLRDELAGISKDAVPPLPGELGTPPATPTAPAGETPPPATAPAATPPAASGDAPPTTPAPAAGDPAAAATTYDANTMAGHYHAVFVVNDRNGTADMDLAADGTGKFSYSIGAHVTPLTQSGEAELQYTVSGDKLSVTFTKFVKGSSLSDSDKNVPANILESGKTLEIDLSPELKLIFRR